MTNHRQFYTSATHFLRLLSDIRQGGGQISPDIQSRRKYPTRPQAELEIAVYTLDEVSDEVNDEVNETV